MSAFASYGPLGDSLKKIDLAQTIGILANIGVIVGIVFLTVEIAQNNDQLASQTRNTIFELRAGLERDVVNNAGGIADLIGKVQHSEALTDVEQLRMNSRRFQLLQTFQYMFQESPDGVRLQVPYMLAMFSADPGLLDTWTRASGLAFDPAFRQFMEETVLPLLN